jgi:putative ABC transport system ATP-binding protein
MSFCVLKNITKTFKIADQIINVLNGINLTFEKNEFISIMGTSGSGKSTLMNIIGCLDVPTSGEYYLDGKLVSKLNDNELSSIRGDYIGFVFQSFYLLSYSNVIDNILLPTIYSHKQKTMGNIEKAREILNLVGLSERENFKPAQLSGGQQQRVAIARALINDPEIILADEPTGQLDSNTTKDIMSLFSKMHSLGKTVIIVTHDQNIANHANKVIRIEDGRIAG